MAFFVALILIVSATLLALARSQRWAPWLLLTGLGLFGALWLLGRLGIPWPNLTAPYVIVLNPYLLLTLSLVLTVGGAVGVAVRLLRTWFGWYRW